LIPECLEVQVCVSVIQIWSHKNIWGHIWGIQKVCPQFGASAIELGDPKRWGNPRTFPPLGGGEGGGGRGPTKAVRSGGREHRERSLRTGRAGGAAGLAGACGGRGPRDSRGGKGVRMRGAERRSITSPLCAGPGGGGHLPPPRLPSPNSAEVDVFGRQNDGI